MPAMRLLAVALATALLAENAAAFSLHKAILHGALAVGPGGRFDGSQCALRMALPEPTRTDAPGGARAGASIFVDEREHLAQQGFPRRYASKVIGRAKDFLQAFSSGELDKQMIAEGFEFAGESRTCPPGAEFYGFSIDPFEPTRVWFTARYELPSTPSGATKERLQLLQKQARTKTPPTAALSCSLTFNADGLATTFAMHSLDGSPASAPAGAASESAAPALKAKPVPKAHQDMQRLEQQCAFYKDEVARLKQKLSTANEMEGEMKELNIQLEKMLVRHETLLAEKEQLAGDLHALKRGAADMAEEMATAAKQEVVTAIERTTDSMGKELEALKQAKVEADSERARLRTQLETVNAEVRAKGRQLVEAHAALEKERGDHAAAMRQAEEERRVWDDVLFALSGRPAETKSQRLFKIALNCLLLGQTLRTVKAAPLLVSRDEQVGALVEEMASVRGSLGSRSPASDGKNAIAPTGNSLRTSRSAAEL